MKFSFLIVLLCGFIFSVFASTGSKLVELKPEVNASIQELAKIDNDSIVDLNDSLLLINEKAIFKRRTGSKFFYNRLTEQYHPDKYSRICSFKGSGGALLRKAIV